MANTKISALTEKTTGFTGNEQFPIADAGSNKRVSYNTLFDALSPRVFRGLSAAQHHWMVLAYPAGTNGITVQNQIPAPAKWTGCRLIYENGTATASTLNTSKVAVTATDEHNGAGLTYTSATFAGASSVALPVIGGAYDATAVITPVVSDHISLPAGAASDYLIVRSYFSGSTCTQNPPAGELALFATETGMTYKTSFAAGVIADGSACGTPTAGQLLCPAGVIWTFSVPSITLACTGGSTLRGQGSTANATGMIYRAAAMLTSGTLVVAPYIGAYSGQNSVVSSANAKKIVSAVRPDILCILPGSGNDSDLTATGFDAMRGRMADTIDYCRINGVIPVVVTLMPSTSLSAPQEALRVAQNAWVNGLSGVVVADVAAVIEDPSNHAQILPAYNAGDGTHINDDGAIAAGTVIAEAISVIIG